MKLRNAITIIAVCSLCIVSRGLFAHQVHGVETLHWHATDTLGFVTVAALAIAAIWLSRK